MSDSSNGLPQLAPLLKDSYATRIKKLAEKQSPKQYFAHIKKYIKKAGRRA